MNSTKENDNRKTLTAFEEQQLLTYREQERGEGYLECPAICWMRLVHVDDKEVGNISELVDGFRQVVQLRHEDRACAAAEVHHQRSLAVGKLQQVAFSSIVQGEDARVWRLSRDLCRPRHIQQHCAHDGLVHLPAKQRVRKVLFGYAAHSWRPLE